MSKRTDIRRYDGHGNVWCFYCEQYRPADCFRWTEFPSKKPGYWSYCKDCTRIVDRLRYRASVSTPEGKDRVLQSRYERKRRQQAKENRERRRFIHDGVETLRRRGFTLSDVSRLTGISLGTFYSWRKWKRPSEAAEARIAIALQYTAHLPIGEQPAYRRRKAHPEIPFLVKRMAADLAKHPMKSGWRYGARDHERRQAA